MRASRTPHPLHRLSLAPSIRPQKPFLVVAPTNLDNDPHGIASRRAPVASQLPIREALAAPFTVRSLYTPVRGLRPECRTVRCASSSSSQDVGHVNDYDLAADVVEVRPIRTMQDLHTTLLGFARAAATPFTSRQASLPHKVRAAAWSSSSSSAAAAEMHREVVLHSTLLRDSSSQSSVPVTTPEGRQANSFAASAVPNGERHLLHRLLLHRREGRRRERDAASRNAADGPGFPPSSSTREAMSASTPASTPTFTGAPWYRAFQLFSEAVQQHHVSPTAQHFNLLLYIAQQHALWGRVDDVEEFWARLLSSVQQLRREKMRDKRRAEQAEWKGGERVGRHRTTPELAQLTSSSLSTHTPPASASPSSSIATPTPAITAAATTRQMDELNEMEQALMPNAQTYELLLGGALARGMWGRALEYCALRTRSGVAMMTDVSVRQVLQAYILAGASGAVTHATRSHTEASPSSPAPYRPRTDERGQLLRAAAQPQRSSNHSTAQGGSAQQSYWSAALHFFRRSFHRVSSMHTVWCMVTLLHRANHPAELVRVVREDCERLVQRSLRSLAAHALTSVERAALLQTLKMVSDAACELGDWCTALQMLREAVELRHQLLSERTALLEQLWGVPHPSGEAGMPFAAVAGGDAASGAPGAPLSHTTTQHLASPDLIGAGSSDEDARLDEVHLSQYVLKNTLHTLRRVRRYAQVIDLYRDTPGPPAAAVDAAAGAAREEEDDDGTVVWRSMWTPSAVGYVAQAALAVRDLGLLLELCGLTPHGLEIATGNAAVSLSTPTEVYDATLRLIQYHIVRQRCEEEKSGVGPSTAATAAKGRDRLQWDVLSQRVYGVYRKRALRTLAEETSPFHVYLERTCHALSSGGEGRAAVARSATAVAAVAEFDAPLLSSSHNSLIQLLAQSLQSGVDSSTVTTSLQEEALKQLQRIRRPDTLAIALVMDILRVEAFQRRFSGEEAQSLLAAVQQVLDTILAEQHIESIQLLSMSPHGSATHGPNGSGSAQSQQSLRYHRCRSGSASLAASRPGAAEVGSKLTPAQLASLSTLTAAAVHMSFDILARVQPLTLLAYIPACVELAWLPSAAAPAQLQLAQQAVVQWADEELKRGAILAAEPQRAAMAQMRSAANGIVGSGGAAATRSDAMDASPAAIQASGRSAVAHFVLTYTQFFSRKAITSSGTPPLVAGSSTAAAAASGRAVLDAAAQILVQLQRSKPGHPPTAAMSAFISALRHAWTVKTSPAHGPLPLETTLLHNAELEPVVVTSLNAVVQQVGASTVGRWTMWGDCVDMLMTYMDSPLATTRRRGTQMEKGPAAVMQSRPDSWRRAEATYETLRVLHMFIRLCDKAETGFVERVTMDWLLLGADSTRSSSTGGGECAYRESSDKDASRHSMVITPVEHLRCLCELAHKQLRRAPPAPHEPFSPPELESMQLLLDALTWACRRQAKPLVRRLYGTLAPWLDTLLQDAALPPPPPPTSRARSVAAGAESAVEKGELLHQQLSRLRETALTACMTVAQCLSSGPRVEVLQDWQLQLRALRQLTNQGNGPVPLSDFGSQRKAAALIDGIAAVAVKLKRTWRYLLTELALDSHRAVCEARRRRSASSSLQPLQLPEAVLRHRKDVEDAAESFAAWCSAELLPRLVLSCLRACVEHEALRGTAPTIAPPPGATPSSPRALVTAALHKVVDAVWDVDFAAFVWKVNFCAREGVDDDGARVQTLARLRTRGYRTLSMELCWPNPDGASQRLARHLHIWILFAVHGAPVRAAVAALCRDLATLDVFQGTRRATACAAAQSGESAAGCTATAASSMPFFLFFAQEVDTLTEAKVAEALSYASCANSAASAAAAPAAGIDGSSSHVAELARMADGRTAMEHLTKPLAHYTPSVLRVVQQAAQWVLYLTLCEGTTDVQAAGGVAEAVHAHSSFLLSVVAQKPRSVGCAATGRAALPSALLLRRCLAWTGQAHAYHALLRVIEATAHETLREPEAVVYVFRYMERLGRAAEGADAATGDGETILSPSPVEAFLAFYMSSNTLRRASPVSERVCLAALLACAANMRRDDAAASPPTVDLLTLLTAFTHVVSDLLVTEWQQGRLSPHQSAVLTEWMLRFLWGGVPVSPMDASTASLERYGVVTAAAADGNVAVVASAALPLRRASMQWLLVTRGTIVPPPLRDEGAEASKLSACAADDSAPQTPPSQAAASAERIASLVTALDRASQRFAACLGGVVVSPSAAAALRGDSSSMLSRESLASELPPRHLSISSPSADANLVRTVLQQLSTRHAAQQLLHRYQSSRGALRSPVRVRDTEAEVLVQVLPEDARDSAKATLRGGADPAASYDSDSAREASRKMARNHARRSVRLTPAANEEEAAELESWLDAAVASLTSTTPGLAPPPPLPVILRCSEQEGGRTWRTLYMQLLSVTKNVHQGREERTHSAARASESLHNLDGYVRRRAVMLRPALLRLMSNLAGTSSRLDPASPSPDNGVGPCVCSLLLMCYVLLPLRSLRPPPSLAEVLAVVRQELWRLLVTCSSASGAGECAPHVFGYLPRTPYNALVQLCVRPLMLEALPQLRLPTFASSESGAAAFEAVAFGLLLVHRVSADVVEIRALSSTLADTAAIYASHRSTVPDANAVNTLQQTARELLHLAGQELYHLHTSFGLAASSPELLQMLYRRLVRAWMQAGVLLGDARSLLWCGQRLTAWSLQKQQEATALAWIAEGYGAVSASTAQSSEVVEADAATEWLCVLPVAVLLAAVCSPALRSSTRISEALSSLASVLPLPQSIRDTASNSQYSSVVVAADEYVSLFRHWQQLLQGHVTEAASRYRGCHHQHWLSCHSPFAVILHGSVPANATPALMEEVRRQVEEYLAGSATWYPPQSQQVTPVSSDVAPALGGGDSSSSSSSSSHATIAAADLCAAFQCVKDASESDMRAFMRLEAAKRAPGGEGVVRGALKKALEVQAAWRLIHRAALQERQQCGSGSGAAAPWTPLVPPAAWRAYLLNLPPVVPHSVHFVPMAVTEVLMLQSCTTWTEGLAVLEHSLRTLHRSGATPVQQYMAQLLLERVRRTEGSAEGFKAADGRVEEHHFCTELETYTYTVLQQQPTEEETSGGKQVAFPRWRLWSQHMAQRSTHGTAALVCRIVDLMFIHHMRTTRASARDTITFSPSVLAKHTLMEALRCGVHDPALTRVLFRLFWAEQHRRVEGAHVFLSALRAAKLARSDALALEAMLTYLRVSDANAATTQRTAEWSSRVLQVINACEARSTIPGSRVPSSGFSSVSAWQHLKAAVEEAAELQGPTHRFSVEAHRATWKSWTVLCRLQVVPKDVALCVVHLFKQYDRLTEVEELMVVTCYDMTMVQADRRVGGGDAEE